MKRGLQNLFYGLLVLLLLSTLAQVGGAAWLVWILLAADAAGTIAILSRTEEASASVFFVLAAAALLLTTYLSQAPITGIGVPGAVRLLCIAAGAPLGLGAMRLLKSRSQTLGAAEILLGAATGMVAVGLVMALSSRVFRATPLLLPLSQIPGSDFLRIGHLFPAPDQTRELICTATGSKTWQCSSLARSLGFFYRTLQACLAAYWDTLVFWPVALLLAAAARLVLPRNR